MSTLAAFGSTYAEKDWHVSLTCVEGCNSYNNQGSYISEDFSCKKPENGMGAEEGSCVLLARKKP